MKQTLGRTLTGLILSFSIFGSAAHAAGKIAFTSSRDGNQEIYVMNPDGTGQTNLSNTPNVSDLDPALSPDGSKIAYRSGNDIWTMNSDGTNPAPLPLGASKVQPKYSPDGQRLLCTYYVDGNYEIFSLPVGSGSATRITQKAFDDYDSDWSPDGQHIAFMGFPDNGYKEEIYLCNADGSGLARLTTTGRNNLPHFSPDGTQIVFDSDRDSGNRQIYVMNYDGSGQRRLTNNAFSDTDPVWSPDGSQIAFVSNRDGDNEIYVMNVDGSGLLKLTDNTADDGQLAWSGSAALPHLSLSGASIAEGNSGTQNMNFLASLSSASTQDVQFTFSTVDGTATAGTDYQSVSYTAVIPAGQTSTTLTVPISGDSAEEPDESFTVRITAVQGAVANVTLPSQILLRNPGNGHLYEFVTGTLTYANAKAAAEARTYGTTHGHLVSITSQAEQDFLTPYFHLGYYWLGALQPPGSIEPGEGFQWSTGEPFGFTNWRSGEPNNANNDVGEDAIVAVSTGTWNDVSSTSTADYYVVEYDVDAKAPVTALEATGVITNDDIFVPSISVADVSVTEGDTGYKEARLKITLSAPSTQKVIVQFASAEGTAQDSDHDSIDGTLTIYPGYTEAFVTVLVYGDLLDEPNETFKLILSNPIGATIGDGVGIGTIIDNDPPPSVSIVPTLTVYEGRTAATQPGFTIALSAPSAKTVTVKYYTTDVKAKAPADYTKTTGIATFAPGQTTQVVQIPITNDAFNEANEEFKVSLTAPANATLKNKVCAATIIDDDGIPSFSVADVSVTEGNTNTIDAIFTVKLSAPSNRAITVKYATADGTALAGVDYTSAPSRQLDFAPHETSKVVKIKVRGDLIDEPNEGFFFKLASPVNATIADGTATGTIIDDDANPSLSINSPSVTEGNDGAKAMNFTVKLSRPSSFTVTANLKTASLAAPAGLGLATSGTDYEAFATTALTFSPGQTSKSVVVKIKGDTLDEADEILGLALSDAKNATVSEATGIGTILDDDASPVLSIHDASVVEGNGTTAVAKFSVTLSVASARTITASYAIADGTATAGNDYRAASGSIVFLPGQTSATIEIPIQGDTMVEGKEQFRVVLSASVGATPGQKTGIGTILDDDATATATSAKSS